LFGAQSLYVDNLFMSVYYDRDGTTVRLTKPYVTRWHGIVLEVTPPATVTYGSPIYLF